MSEVGENPRPNVATVGTSVPFEEGERNPLPPKAAALEGILSIASPHHAGLEGLRQSGCAPFGACQG